MIFTNLHAASNTWNTVGKAKEKGLFDFDFIKWIFSKQKICIVGLFYFRKIQISQF